MRVELHASAVTSGPSYDYVQMLEGDEGLKFTVTGTTVANELIETRYRKNDSWRCAANYI